MLGIVGQLLPIAFVAAISSVPITVMIFILLSPRRKIAALPYLFGTVTGVLLIVTLATLLTQALPESRVREKDPLVGILELLVGLALVVVGAVSWRRRDRSGGAPPVPRWAAAVDALTAVRAFGLGVILGLRPKSALLAAVIGLQLHVASLSGAATVVAGVIYVVIATSTVTVPILLTLLAPSRMEPWLANASTRLTAEAPLVSSAALILIGIVVIGVGLQTFS